MTEYKDAKVALSIENALRSLYKLIVLVEDRTSLCYFIDVDDELSHAFSREQESFGSFCSLIYRNTHPDDREKFRMFSESSDIHRVLSKEIYISIECRIRHKNRRYYWSELTICNAFRSNSTDGRDYLFLIRDIDAAKRAQIKENEEATRLFNELKSDYDRLFIENMTDQQTGCYNRKGLKYFEEETIRESQGGGKDLFVCVLDLNGLKHLNDTYGHPAGDAAIKAVADALRASVPTGAKIIRTGGDEFLVFCVMDDSGFEPDNLGAAIEKELADYNDSHDNPFKVSASYGWVIEPAKEGMDSLDELIEAADKIMYEMKERTDPYKR